MLDAALHAAGDGAQGRGGGRELGAEGVSCQWSWRRVTKMQINGGVPIPVGWIKKMQMRKGQARWALAEAPLGASLRHRWKPD
eukprot:365939-Chlamydomonas_euryale.AAC.11